MLCRSSLVVLGCVLNIKINHMLQRESFSIDGRHRNGILAPTNEN